MPITKQTAEGVVTLSAEEEQDFAAFQASAAPILADVQARALAAIDAKAEAVRLRYITAGDGQAMTYRQKAAEAEAYAAADYPADTGPYPFLAAEAAATESTAAAVADLVLGTRSAWLTTAAEIEGERMGGKAAVTAAADVAAAEAALGSAVAALDLL